MKSICIVGSGYMAFEHAKASLELNYDQVYVIGRTTASFERYFNDTQQNSSIIKIEGGVSAWLASEFFRQGIVHIVAVAVEALEQVTEALLYAGVKRILLEKPGGLNIKGLKKLNQKAEDLKSIVRIAYNRRHYPSVQKLKDILSTEELTSFEFEFTEWVDKINPDDYDQKTLEEWIVSNSAHVIDTAFYLAGGLPTVVNHIASGKDKIMWHRHNSIFIGCGLVSDVPFTYSADWRSQGRWRIHMRSIKGKYILEPMEKLSFVPKNSLSVIDIDLTEYQSKHGLAPQIQAFEANDHRIFATLNDQVKLFEFVNNLKC